MLITSFTPRTKNNMIGLMVARCDGEHLSELVVLQVSKQELIFGTMRIGARINQDQTISKDLSLWNQQGSQVLRGQTLVLPVGNTFLHVEPFYIQASEARMPQLKKVILAIGNTLIYRDTYEQTLGDVGSIKRSPNLPNRSHCRKAELHLDRTPDPLSWSVEKRNCRSCGLTVQLGRALLGSPCKFRPLVELPRPFLAAARGAIRVLQASVDSPLRMRSESATAPGGLAATGGRGLFL